jgi:transcriptional regulator with XRE-family HTH domain
MTPILLRIRELRRARGWSQAELAGRAGIRQATVSRLESGAVSSISLGILEKIAMALEVDPGYLLVRRP